VSGGVVSPSAVVVPTQPFAFELALRYLQTSPSAITEVIEDGTFTRAVRLHDRPAVLQVACTLPTSGPAAAAGRAPPLLPPPARASDRDRPVLRVAVLGEGLGAAHLHAGVSLARRVFATDADVTGLERAAARDPVFAATAHRFRGLRPVLIADPFEALIWAIIGQQINVRFASQLKRALVERFGERVTAGGRAFPLFPSPDSLAALDHARDLRPLQFSRQKSEYIIHAARAVAAGRLDFESLRGLPAEEAVARLTALKGVGRWTAEYVLLRGLGHADAIPAADGGLRRAIGHAYGLGRPAHEAEVRAIARQWAGWRGYAAFYWWFTLQLAAEVAARARRPRG
jgi:DNA-3-methyladenine glycosylase II